MHCMCDYACRFKFTKVTIVIVCETRNRDGNVTIAIHGHVNKAVVTIVKATVAVSSITRL